MLIEILKPSSIKQFQGPKPSRVLYPFLKGMKVPGVQPTLTMSINRHFYYIVDLHYTFTQLSQPEKVKLLFSSADG